MARRLAYAILFGSDLQRSIRLYRDVLGLPFRFSNESYAEFSTEGAKLSLYARSHLPRLLGREAPPGAVPWPQDEVVFSVATSSTRPKRKDGAP